MNEIEIKKLRVDLRLTVVEVQRRTGLSRRTIYKTLSGQWRRKETRDSIQRVFNAVGDELKGAGIRMSPVPRLWDD